MVSRTLHSLGKEKQVVGFIPLSSVGRPVVGIEQRGLSVHRRVAHRHGRPRRLPRRRQRRRHHVTILPLHLPRRQPRLRPPRRPPVRQRVWVAVPRRDFFEGAADEMLPMRCWRKKFFTGRKAITVAFSCRPPHPSPAKAADPAKLRRPLASQLILSTRQPAPFSRCK